MPALRQLAEKLRELWTAEESHHRFGSLLPVSLLVALLILWLVQI